jgi:putative endonuclease
MERPHLYFVYIMASKPYGTLYTGVTNKLMFRVEQHKDGALPGFTKRYGVDRLAYYEFHGDIHQAIKREKQIKRWRREWKTNLIERDNPRWVDLYENLVAEYWRRLRLFNEAHQRPGVEVT